MVTNYLYCLGLIRYLFTLSPIILSDVSRSLAAAVIFPRVLFNASIIISLSNVDRAACRELEETVPDSSAVWVVGGRW